MVFVNDDEIGSAELDELLDAAETVRVDQPEGPTQIRLYIAIDAETLRQLERRAAETGAPITETASAALRDSTHAA